MQQWERAVYRSMSTMAGVCGCVVTRWIVLQPSQVAQQSTTGGSGHDEERDEQ